SWPGAPSSMTTIPWPRPRDCERALAERILVVDDDPDVCTLIESNLALEGYQVRTVGDGARAVEEAVHWQPELVLLDIMLPGMDGLEVLKALRADPRSNAASIIMLTARSLAADRMTAITAGCDDYIVKPF